MAEGSSDTRQSIPLTLLKLKTMKGDDGKPLKIVQKIAAHDYTTFGMCLLQDENGEEVDLIEKDHINKGGAKAVTEEIFKKWLSSDAPTRTYQHLIDCLRQSQLGALARLIEKAPGICCSDLTSKVPKKAVNAVNDTASYASYLKGRYNYMSQELTAQHWSHLPQCEYIQLAMIDSKRRRHEVEEEEIREILTQEGKVKPILDTKEPIKLDCLFSTGPLVVLPHSLPKPRVILVEAAPGGGKSTLALHICHQWAQGASFLERFDIVVLAYLRDGAIQDAKYLADILPADVLVSRMEIASEIIACRGNSVLFIFDGWDEFPSKLWNNSVVSDIIRKSYSLPLDDCTILITSRSESSLDLHDIANRRVEILGFTQERIHEYIYKALVEHDGNDTRVHKLVEHLKDHPVIEEYCYVPLHAAILVHVFLTKNGVFPSTLHELFSDFLLCCVVRELKTHDKINFEVSSLEKLPDDLNCKLNDLRLLAYKGVMQDKVLFYEKDLLEFELNPLTIKSFGLLQSVQGLTLSSKSVSYNFLHLSVQEHLAALYISKLPSADQVEVFKNLFEDNASRFQAVLHHYSGLTKLDTLEIQHFISTYSDYQLSDDEILPLLHCFYEAQQPSLCKLVGPRFKKIYYYGDNSDFVPIDYLVIGYFITSLLSTSDMRLILYIRDIDERCLKLLLVELCKQADNKELPGRLQLIISIDAVQTKELRQLEPLITDLSFIDDLIIWISQDEIQFYTMLQNNCHLTKLQILTDSNYYPDFNQSITTMLHSTNLTHLNLSCSEISDEGACCIFRCLQGNKTLLNLNLCDIGIEISENTAQELLSMLKINKTLSYLDLSHQKRLSNCHFLVITVFQGLCHNTALVHLNLSHIVFDVSEEIRQALVTMLQVNKTLTHLDLSHNCELSDSGAGYLFHGLQHNTALVHLDLSSTGIKFESETESESESETESEYYNTGKTAKLIWLKVQESFSHCFQHLQCFQMLSIMLQLNKSLTHLDLSNNSDDFNFSEDSWVCILQGLQHNTALVNLNLSNCFQLKAATTQALATMLSVNRTLTYLDISWFRNSELCSRWYDYYNSEIQASCIWEALMHNTTLTHLNLRCTGLKFNDQAFTTMLQVNKTLTHLDLSDNDNLARCIYLGLQHNTALVSLKLCNTNLKFNDQALTTMLQVNKALTHLDLSGELFLSLTDSEVYFVCQGLQHNTALLHLGLSFANITNKGAEYIAQALHSNRSLQTLDISDNENITDDGFTLIAESLKTNKTLKTLYIDDCSITPRLAKTVYQANFRENLDYDDHYIVHVSALNCVHISPEED